MLLSVLSKFKKVFIQYFVFSSANKIGTFFSEANLK